MASSWLKAVRREIIAEVEAPYLTPDAQEADWQPYDRLPEHIQHDFGSEDAYDQAQENISLLEEKMSAEKFAAMGRDYEELPADAQAVARRLAGLWGRVDDETLIYAYEELSDWLPLQSSAELSTFLERHKFIQPRG